MEDQNVAIRLKGFIDSQGLTHSQFSDRCGIPRPSLSQIISGRNKKVSDVIVSQIHKAFPQLSILWLLFGEGSMLNSLENSRPSNQSEENIQFSENSESSANSDPDVQAAPIYDDAMFDDVSIFTDSASAGEMPAFRNSGSQTGSGNVNSGSVKPESASNRTGDSKFSNVNALNTTAKALQVAKQQLVEAENKIVELQLQIEKMSKNPRKVSHITVYYDDSTFETFAPRP